MCSLQNLPDLKKSGILATHERETIICLHGVLGLPDKLPYERFDTEKPGHHYRYEGDGYKVEFHTAAEYKGDFCLYVEKTQAVIGRAEAVRIFGTITQPVDATSRKMIHLDSKTPSIVYVSAPAGVENRPKVMIDMGEDFGVTYPVLAAPDAFEAATPELIGMKRETAAYCLLEIAQNILMS